MTSTSGKGVYASSGTLFKGAVFGRDSLEVAEDLLDIKPQLVKHILVTLAGLQGMQSDDVTEEEQGRIIHEYRSAIVDGKQLDNISRRIFRELSSRWGGNNKEMAYYGSIDATPQFIRTVGLYCQLKGKQILAEKIIRKDKTEGLFIDSIEIALGWLSNKLSDSKTGLLEYHAKNSHGIENQAWKDSREFYVHENGELANRESPIASIEVQGLAYDALLWGAKLLPRKAKQLKTKAKILQNKTFKLLWQSNTQYFALGTDYRRDGSIRTIKTITANPAELLNTSVFDDLNKRDKKTYISAIVKRIMSSDFITDGGIRSRSLNENKLIGFWDYHGSYTSWPKETFDIAKGLRRQGFDKLAVQLENRILNIVHKSRSYPEFVYVNNDGRVIIGDPVSKTHGELSLIKSTNQPETIQAWTVAAVIAIGHNRSNGVESIKKRQKHWQRTLEKKILSQIPDIQPLHGIKQLSAIYPDYQYKLIK